MLQICRRGQKSTNKTVFTLRIPICTLLVQGPILPLSDSSQGRSRKEGTFLLTSWLSDYTELAALWSNIFDFACLHDRHSSLLEKANITSLPFSELPGNRSYSLRRVIKRKGEAFLKEFVPFGLTSGTFKAHTTTRVQATRNRLEYRKRFVLFALTYQFAY